ncbi:MAG: phosphodiesterase [Deltaproteobacteria bacterium]|jgi:putative phosphoesterase|nr:phosphodiesterase [Deltaproteobacteria bacterium]
MGILVASDIHGAVAAAEALAGLAAERKPSLVLLLGDLLYHGPRNALPGTYDAPEAARILSSIAVPVASVRGNCDAEVDQLLLPWTFAENSYLDLGGVPFMAVHGHQLPWLGGQLRLPPGLGVIHGHTHVPLAGTRDDGTRVWNPGSLGIPKGGFPASYGWIGDGLFRVLGLDGGTIMEDPLPGAPAAR